MAEVHAGAAESGILKLEGNYVTGHARPFSCMGSAAVVTRLWTHHLQVHESPAPAPLLLAEAAFGQR